LLEILLARNYQHSDGTCNKWIFMLVFWIIPFTDQHMIKMVIQCNYLFLMPSFELQSIIL
jgi:hypothetical protein